MSYPYPRKKGPRKPPTWKDRSNDPPMDVDTLRKLGLNMELFGTIKFPKEQEKADDANKNTKKKDQKKKKKMKKTDKNQTETDKKKKTTHKKKEETHKEKKETHNKKKAESTKKKKKHHNSNSAEASSDEMQMDVDEEEREDTAELAEFLAKDDLKDNPFGYWMYDPIARSRHVPNFDWRKRRRSSVETMKSIARARGHEPPPDEELENRSIFDSDDLL